MMIPAICKGVFMIRILICCGGGFSSSVLVKRVQDQIAEKGYQDKIQVDFSSIYLVEDKFSNYDVVMCCPHLSNSLPHFIELCGGSVPFYLLPTRMYGLLNARDIYEDALDIIEQFKITKKNPFCFPGEENYFSVQRTHSYRREHKNNN